MNKIFIRVKTMTDYKSMYFKLAGKVADAIEILVEAQREGEQSYIDQEDTPPSLKLLDKSDKKDDE